jgi:hypothetical protein
VIHFLATDFADYADVALRGAGGLQAHCLRQKNLCNPDMVGQVLWTFFHGHDSCFEPPISPITPMLHCGARSSCKHIACGEKYVQSRSGGTGSVAPPWWPAFGPKVASVKSRRYRIEAGIHRRNLCNLWLPH